MKTTSILIGALLVVNGLSAQNTKTFKTKFGGAGKSIVINIDAKQLDIEGYNGDEVIIEANNIPEVPKEADGLRPLSAAGVENTNTGLSVNANGNTLNITSVMKGKTVYKIKAPQEVAITIKKRNSCSCNEEGMSVSNMEGPLEINTNYEDITLLDVTGPIVANSNQGKIKVVFNEKMPDKPSSIISYGDHIDVTVPEKAKVLFSVSSSNGNMFTDLDLKPYTAPVKEESKRELEERESRSASERRANSSSGGNNVTVNGAKVMVDGKVIQPAEAPSATTYSYSTSKNSDQSPSVFYWDGGQWNSNVTGFTSYGSWSDNDRTAAKYVLNDPQTKITVRSTQGNVYLRKKK
jgi:hypothetical protein